MYYIDTHAHLNADEFNEDLEEVINRAKEKGVEKIIVVGTGFESSKHALKIAENHEGIYASCALHPIHLDDEGFNENDYLEIAKQKKIVAIGETGVDYHHTHKDANLQKEIFLKHIKIANLVNKPLIIHARDSYDDVLSILTSLSTMPRGVFHCYSGNWSFAKAVLEMGFYLSFTGIITFTKDEKIFEVIREAPLERIMIETDCPLIAPEPYRGVRNEPVYVIEIAKKIAEIKKISLEEVAEATTKNAIELFKLN